MGAFLPWFRNHYDNYYKPFQEPYRYEEPVPTICRKYIEMRYRLIGYIYDAMYENTLNGKPICRPLFMDETQPGVFSNDPAADDPHEWGYNGFVSNRLDDQFFLGRDLLIAPVINPGLITRCRMLVVLYEGCLVVVSGSGSCSSGDSCSGGSGIYGTKSSGCGGGCGSGSGCGGVCISGCGHGSWLL